MENWYLGNSCDWSCVLPCFLSPHFTGRMLSCLSREQDGQAQYSIPRQSRFVGYHGNALADTQQKYVLHIFTSWSACVPSFNQRSYLKEKLPQAFMQIGWMKTYFRNLPAKVWANLDNPIKSYDFSNFWLISCMLPSQGHFATICDVTTVQFSNGTLHNF